MKFGLTAIALAALISSSTILNPVVLAQNQQSTVPDAPTPQAPPQLSGVNGSAITPGKGSEETPANPTSSSASPVQQQPPAAPSQPPAAPVVDTVQTAPPEGFDALPRFVLNVNFVEVPVTVKDSKGNLVAGLTFRDFQVYENNTRVPLQLFSVDPAPLSVAFVIDQSLTSDVMAKVNDSLDAIQGALTPYDEVAVFTYNNGAQERTAFTGAQSSRLPAVLALTKATGSDMLVPINSGPLAGCSIRQNGACVDPNLQPGGSAGGGTFITIPKEIHTLNDAILAAAKELSTRPKERRRIVYVVSDGKEHGSKASLREVIRYLQTNKIAVFATGVGTSANWGEGYISRIHLPFTMYDNILYKYTAATGGDFDSERSMNGIEKSYAKIAEEARTQYTLGYLSHESIYDGKYRSIDVRVNRPGMDVKAKAGYYPSAQDRR
ncbi:MAG: VWA domain-containing protein [Terracidiphilus sp.]|nr:VWA domain-containing protein [Terracidiphilus sp.]